MNCKKKNHKNFISGFIQPHGSGAGFTLFEVVISLGLLLTVIVGFAVFTSSILNIRSKLQSQLEVQGNLRVALDSMSQKIRGSRGVNVSTSVLGVNSSVLSLIMSDPAKNPTVFRLDHADGTLLIQEGVSQPQALTTHEVQITQLLFSLYSSSGDPENIHLELSARYAQQGNSYTSYADSLQTSVSVRR